MGRFRVFLLVLILSLVLCNVIMRVFYLGWFYVSYLVVVCEPEVFLSMLVLFFLCGLFQGYCLFQLVFLLIFFFFFALFLCFFLTVAKVIIVNSIVIPADIPVSIF